MAYIGIGEILEYVFSDEAEAVELAVFEHRVSYFLWNLLIGNGYFFSLEGVFGEFVHFYCVLDEN